MTIVSEEDTTLCPSCGAKLNIDDELCRSCGKLTFDVNLSRKISPNAIVSGKIVSWLHDAIRHTDKKTYEIGPQINPATGLPVKNGVDSAGNVVGRGGPWDDE